MAVLFVSDIARIELDMFVVAAADIVAVDVDIVVVGVDDADPVAVVRDLEAVVVEPEVAAVAVGNNH
jgi:F420-0:gamma-glutamyl ligase